MEQDQGEAALMTDVGYLRALVEHTVPLAAVPDGATAQRIRTAAGISRQLAGCVLGVGAKTILRFEANYVTHSRRLENSERYRALLAALFRHVAGTDPTTADEIRRQWKPIDESTRNDKDAA
jgi:hypothetical protein